VNRRRATQMSVWLAANAALLAGLLLWRASKVQEIRRAQSATAEIVLKTRHCAAARQRPVTDSTYELGLLVHRIAKAATAEEHGALQSELDKRLVLVRLHGGAE
jgi:hypothetical protein